MNDSPLNLSDNLLTPADLVGRACRIARLRWQEFVRIFAVSGFCYTLAWVFISTPLATGSIKVYATLGVVSILVLVAARLEMSVIEYAIIMVLTGHADDLRVAKSKARRKAGFIFLVTLPITLLDVVVLLLAAFSEWLMGHDTSNVVQVSIGAGIYLFLISLSVPFICLWLLNLTFITTLIAEDLTFWSCWRRFTHLLSRQLGYVAAFILLYSIFSFMLEAAIALLCSLESLTGLFNGTLKTTLKILAELIECFLMTPLYAFLAASGAVGCFALHDQITKRLEGTDLIKRLESCNK